MGRLRAAEHAEKYGIPLEPVGAQTTEANWKKRKKGPLRRALTFLVTLAVVAGIGYAAYLGYQQFAPATDENPPQLPLDDPDTLIGRSNELTNEINDNADEAAALDQLGLDATGAPAPAVDATVGSALTAQSYSLRWTVPDGTGYDLYVDAATKNFSFFRNGVEVRRVGDEMFSFDAVAGWTQLDVGIDEATFVGLRSIVTIDDVVVEAARPFVTTSDLDANGSGRYVIDDVAFHAAAPEARAAWITQWGTGDVADPKVGDADIVISVIADQDGVVNAATVTAASLGGTTRYELLGWSPLPNAIEAPDLP
jgi:hypothetical protein